MIPKGTLNTKLTAAYLNLSESTLRQSRMDGPRKNRCPVPPYIRLGRRIVYRIEDLDAFLEANKVSTAKESA